MSKSDFAAYVFYVNRPDLLQRSLDSFAALKDDLTIVDNSVEWVANNFQNPAYVFRPPVPLSYTQSMNWMLKDAEGKGVDFIFHFHSDAVSTNPDAVNQLLEYARRMKAENRKWACLWTFYDILWAINPTAARAVGGWDTNFAAYFCDQDMRRRWNLAGWETIDTHIEGISHDGSATIRSDPKMEYLNSVTFPLFRQYYAAKWDGEPGHERFTEPFDGALEKRDQCFFPASFSS